MCYIIVAGLILSLFCYISCLQVDPSWLPFHQVAVPLWLPGVVVPVLEMLVVQQVKARFLNQSEYSQSFVGVGLMQKLFKLNIVF